MREQEDRLARPRPPQPRHQVALSRRGREHLDIRRAQARGAKPGGHGLGRARGIARGGDRVDLDKLLVDVDGQLLLSGPGLGAHRRSEASQT